MRSEAAATISPTASALVVLTLFHFWSLTWSSETSIVILAAAFAYALPIGIFLSAGLVYFLQPALEEKDKFTYLNCVLIPMCIAAALSFATVGAGEIFAALTAWGALSGAVYKLLYSRSLGA